LGIGFSQLPNPDSFHGSLFYPIARSGRQHALGFPVKLASMTASRILITTFTLAQDLPFRRVASLAGKNYSDAVALAGGLPFMVSNLSPALAEAYCDHADGVLFSGGGDVEPRLVEQH
jgi:hypothetical protein